MTNKSFAWDRLGDLSRREKQLAPYLAAGLQDKEIAHIAERSVETIKTHTKNIRRKLGARNRADAARILAEKKVKPRGLGEPIAKVGGIDRV